jgi:hypothetical protein
MSEHEMRRVKLSAGSRNCSSWFEWLFVIGLVFGGVIWDWYCAFEWSSGKSPLFSLLVIRRMSAIVALCAAVGFLVVRLRQAKWQVGVAIFFLASGILSGNILLWWIGHR